ncbi:hypothetical protein HDV05_005360 [Chytridiales sp. JEL 0842]|nr:hypothetical protein HDV05_005360 [Chytridiales sp. JEL 0842]
MNETHQNAALLSAAAEDTLGPDNSLAGQTARTQPTSAETLRADSRPGSPLSRDIAVSHSDSQNQEQTQRPNSNDTMISSAPLTTSNGWARANTPQLTLNPQPPTLNSESYPDPQSVTEEPPSTTTPSNSQQTPFSAETFPSSRISSATPEKPPTHPQNTLSETPATVRRRRSGWWDGKENKEREMERVKMLVRRTSEAFGSDDKDPAESENEAAAIVHSAMSPVIQNQRASSPAATPQHQAIRAIRGKDTRRNSSVNMRALLMQEDPETPSKASSVSDKLPPLTNTVPVENETIAKSVDAVEDVGAEPVPTTLAPAAEKDSEPKKLTRSKRMSVRQLRPQSNMESESEMAASSTIKSSIAFEVHLDEPKTNSTVSATSSTAHPVAVKSSKEPLKQTTADHETPNHRHHEKPSKPVTQPPLTTSDDALIKEYELREKQMKTRMNLLQSKLNQAEATAARYRDLFRDFSILEVKHPIPSHFCLLN